MLKTKQVISTGIHNIVAEGTVITGDIRAEEDFRIDGIVDGKIECNGKVIIGMKGAVTGEIICQNAEICGTLQGTIRTTGNLILKSTAVFSGNAFTNTVEIEPGAVYNGNCAMLN